MLKWPHLRDTGHLIPVSQPTFVGISLKIDTFTESKAGKEMIYDKPGPSALLTSRVILGEFIWSLQSITFAPEN